jgi:hypothetical protein
MAKFCETCGASLLDGAKFCNDCGQALALKLAEQPESVIEQSIPETSTRRTKTLVGTVLGMIMLFGGG